MLTTNPIANPTTPSNARLPIAAGSFASLTGNSIVNYQPLDLSAIVINNGIGTLPFTTPAPTTIGFGNTTYTYTLNPNPSLGQFTIANGNLIINVGTGSLPPIVSAFVPAPSIPTTFVPPPYPSLLSLYPIAGELTWTMGFEEQPSGQFKFTALARNRESIISQLQAKPNYYVYGCGLTPNNIQISEVSKAVSDPPLIEITVSLTGVHADKFNTIIAPNATPNPGNCLDPIPSPAAPTGIQPSVQLLAAKAGVAITGARIDADKSLAADKTAQTTLGAQLTENRARAVGGIIDYNSINAIEIKNYGSTPTYQLRQIVDRLNTTDTGNLNGYAKTYDPPSKLTWGSNAAPVANPSPIGSPPPPPPDNNNVPIVEGDADPSVSPYPAINRDLSIVFDISGKRKRKKTTRMQDGQPLLEIEEEWGFVAVAKDHMQLTNDTQPSIININGSWQQIAYKTTTYTYNNLNYLTSRQTTGFIKSRYRVENAQNPESNKVRISGSTPDPIEVAKLETYRFFDLPIVATETYVLESMRSYYADIKPPKIIQVNCLPDGTRVELSIDDPEWVPPYYVKEKIYKEEAFASIVNPESTALKPLPNLTTGTSKQYVERVQIIKNAPTLGQLVSYQDRHIKTTDNYGASGAQFNAILNIGESQTISGRPPLATRRTVATVVSPSGNTPNIGQSPTTQVGIRSGVDPRYSNYNGVAGSIDYPNARTEAEAVAAAKLDLNIYNLKNSQKTTLTCDFRPQIRPGDRVDYLANSYRNGRVISTTNRLRIEGLVENGGLLIPYLTSLGTELTIGKEVSVPVSTFVID